MTDALEKQRDYNRAYYRDVRGPARQAEMVPPGPCHYCGSTDRLEPDHVVPTSKGGTDDAGNIVPACKPCNSSKQARTIEEWREFIGCALAGLPYFTPQQIAFLRAHDFDLEPIRAAAAARVRFRFEDGRGEAVQDYHRSRVAKPRNLP